MKPFPPRILLPLLAGLFLALSARAHLPNESAVVLSADEEALFATVSLSLFTASALLPDDAAPLSPDTFESHRATLRDAVPRVCVLLDAQDKPLAPERVFVSLRDAHEIRFQLLFPLSARPVRLRMPLLAASPAGAFCAVTDLRPATPARATLTADAPAAVIAP